MVNIQSPVLSPKPVQFGLGRRWPRLSSLLSGSPHRPQPTTIDGWIQEGRNYVIGAKRDGYVRDEVKARECFDTVLSQPDCPANMAAKMAGEVWFPFHSDRLFSIFGPDAYTKKAEFAVLRGHYYDLALKTQGGFEGLTGYELYQAASYFKEKDMQEPFLARLAQIDAIEDGWRYALPLFDGSEIVDTVSQVPDTQVATGYLLKLVDVFLGKKSSDLSQAESPEKYSIRGLYKLARVFEQGRFQDTSLARTLFEKVVLCKDHRRVTLGPGFISGLPTPEEARLINDAAYRLSKYYMADAQEPGLSADLREANMKAAFALGLNALGLTNEQLAGVTGLVQKIIEAKAN